MIEPRPGDEEQAGGSAVSVLNAGVLHHFVEDGLIPALRRERGIAASHESGPSVALARGLRDGSRIADVFLSADAQVNALLMGRENAERIRWYVSFARNEVVLVYGPRSRQLSEFQKAAAGEIPWFEPLLRPGVRLVRGDPNLDPLAYYTLFIGQLAELHHGVVGLKQRILGDDLNPIQIAGLSLGGLDTGEVDAIFLYRSLALDRQLPFVTLPKEIHLGDPGQSGSYGRASFTSSHGETFRGGPIRLSATVLTNTGNPERAIDLVAYLLSAEGQQLLRQYHFLPTDATRDGDAAALPGALQRLLPGSSVS